ncbi:glucosamine-phosphate N-acetyltransferase [Entomortierella parvispora]|uniref:Glucosamine 6-phosphate N-acetyltransferase n=1 Tax=Entomortierella parvispora TaxID=205924 RepID=A0A9P3H4G6_9FUNG|nr:glucosamine-phosphate N-acetyltransferase [Entomortierella parvispora]
MPANRSPFKKSDDLLFDPALIPAALQEKLPSGYVIRPLSRTDNQIRSNTSFLKTLQVLTTVGSISDQAFQDRFTYLKQHSDQYYTIVIEDMNVSSTSPPTPSATPLLVTPGRGKIVGAGTVLVERKFIHELGLVGHIEDIAVSADQQGKKLGQRIIETLMAIGEQVGCYKVILDCSEKNVPFYEKCGFERKGVEMGWYVNKQKKDSTSKTAGLVNITSVPIQAKL